MLDEFHVRPWETSEDHEVYKEDISNMIALKQQQREGQKYNMEKQQWLAEVRAKRS